MKPQNSTKLIGMLGVLLLTFGITYFDFSSLTNEQNVKPAFMMFFGLVAVVFFVMAKRNEKN